jgi:hypothetical protein
MPIFVRLRDPSDPFVEPLLVFSFNGERLEFPVSHIMCPLVKDEEALVWLPAELFSVCGSFSLFLMADFKKQDHG